MDEILDNIWAHLEFVLSHTVLFLDKIISPLEMFGAGFVIFFLAALVVLLTRLVKRFYVTKRFIRLKKEFEHWHNVREEALKHPDPEKGKALAKNIDQAELNRAYYDYFFEGMLKNIITNALPILLTAAFIIKIYTPENLMDRFGSEWVFVFKHGASQIQISSLFFYVISLLSCFIFYGVAMWRLKKKEVRKSELVKA